MKINEWLQKYLKEEIEELKKKEGRSEEEKKKVMSENKQLMEPLQKATEDLRELKRKLTNYEKDKLSLAVSVINNNWVSNILTLLLLLLYIIT